MVGVWIANITPLYDEAIYQRFYKVVPEFRQQKADRLRCTQKKAQSIGAWYLLQKLIVEYDLKEFPAFNLSHSGDFVLCAMDMNGKKDINIGCDIEQIRKIDLKIGERFFCEREYQYIQDQNSLEEKYDSFYRYWVLKESYVKATKKGLLQDTKSFEIQLTSPPRFIHKLKQSKEYYYQEFSVTGLPYKIAVCSDQNEICTTIKTELMDCFQHENP